MYLAGDGERFLILSSRLTFSVVILCATGSKTIALPLLVLPNDLGSGAGVGSFFIARIGW